MGIRKERLRRKTASGTYDTIHLETSADIVLLSDGSGLLEDELAKVKPIEKGGTGSSTADEALRSLINGCETLDKAEAGDWFFVLDKDAQTVKKISLEELQKFSGGTQEPEEPVEPEHDWPDKFQLTLGNNITWAGHDWIVVHVTSTEVYLALKNTYDSVSKYDIDDRVMNRFSRTFTDDQLECLKLVYWDSISSEVSSKVFVASEQQLKGGFAYFTSDNRRKADTSYWTSTGYSGRQTYVDRTGGFALETDEEYDMGYDRGYRPFVCIDLTLYE